MFYLCLVCPYLVSADVGQSLVDALNTLEYMSGVFYSLFLQFKKQFYSKCLCSCHCESIHSQESMMALNISVRKFNLCFENISVLMHLVKVNIFNTS